MCTPSRSTYGVVLCYDPDRDRWQFVAPMGTKRGCLGLAELDGQIYAVGGQDDQGVKLCSAEKYDPALSEWQPIAPMAEASLLG